MSMKSYERAKQNALLLPVDSKSTVAFTQDVNYTTAPDIVTEQYDDTLLQAASKKEWLLFSAAHQREVSMGEIDESFKVPLEALQSYKDQGYTDKEIEFIAASHSQDNLQVRVERIAKDRQLDKQLDEAGWSGVGARLWMGMSDPALIPTMFATGGAASMTKLNTAKAVGLSLLEGAAVNGALEYYLERGDTQRDKSDVLIAMASGAALSGLVTVGSRGYGNFRQKAEDARRIDADNNDAINGVVADKELRKVDEALQQGMPDAAQRKRFTTERDILDEMGAEVRAKSTDGALSKKKVQKLKQEFREYLKMQKERMGKISASNMRPSAKNKQIQQLQDAIDKREAALNEKLGVANEAATTRAELDALQQGVIPKSLEKRYKELKAELGEADLSVKIGEDVDKTSKSVQDEEMKKMPDVEQPEAKSAGAAAVDPLTAKYDMYGNLLPELDEGSVTTAIKDSEAFGSSAPRISRMATGVPVTRSLSSFLDSSHMDFIRGIGAKLFPNGVRTIKGHQSAVEVKDAIFHRGMQFVNEFNIIKDDWLSQRGISWWEWSKQAEASREFDRLTALAQKTGEGDELILQAAKKRAEINKLALESNKAYGVHGFENVNHTDDYVSVVYDYDNITDLVAKGARPEEVVDAIAKGYMTGGIPIKEQYAITLAKAQVERAMKTKAGTNQAYRFSITESDFKHVEKALLDEGLDARSVKELRESIFSDDLKSTRSPRAMHSLKPNLNATSGNVRMIDAIDTSINRNIKYLQDSAADCGMYSVGIQGRKHLEQVLDEADKAMQNQLLVDMKNYEVGSKAHTQLAKELDNIKNGKYRHDIQAGVDLMYGRSIETGNDVAGDALNNFRKLTNILRLATTGLTTIPEWGYALVRTGGIRTLRAATGSRFVDMRKGSIAKDEFMAEFSKTLGATGHQEYLFGRYAYNGSDFDDVAKTRLGQVMNKFLDKGMNATMVANIFRTVQHGGEEAVARAVVSGLKDAAKSGTMNKVVKSLQGVGGLSDTELKDIMKVLNKHDDIFDGVRMLEPQLQNKLAAAVKSHIGTSFLRVRVGEASMVSHQRMGKLFTHLLNFAIGSYEKQLVRGIKHEKALLTSAIMAQAGLGVAAHAAYVYQKAAAMDGSERQAYIDKQMSEEGIFYGALNKVGVLAAPMTVMQMLASFNLLPDAIQGSPSKSGIQSYSGIPTVGMVSDLTRAGRGAVGLAKDEMFNEYETDTDEVMRDIKRISPIVNTPLWNMTAGQVLAED